MLHDTRGIPVAISCLFLAACSSGGGDGNGKANVTSVDLGAPPVFADGKPITSVRFNGQSFPLYFVEGFSNGVATELRRGSGIAIVSVDGDGLTLRVDDSAVVDLERIGTTSGFETRSLPSIFFVVDDLDVMRTVSAEDPSLTGSSALVGGFGFQTPADLMPDRGSASYSTDGFGRIILSGTGDNAITALDSDAGVSINVNFANGAIEGDLFNGGGFADVDGDGFADDALLVVISLDDARVSGGTFDGELRGDAVAFIDDVDFVNLNPTFSNTDVDGVFFGNDADRIAGTYEGDYRSDGPGGSFAGYFDVGRD